MNKYSLDLQDLTDLNLKEAQFVDSLEDGEGRIISACVCLSNV